MGSDTPRVDAIEDSNVGVDYAVAYAYMRSNARELERELTAARARIAELEEALREDAARLDWLERNPKLGEIHFDDGTTKDVYYYAISGASGLKLREIIDAARKDRP